MISINTFIDKQTAIKNGLHVEGKQTVVFSDWTEWSSEERSILAQMLEGHYKDVYREEKDVTWSGIVVEAAGEKGLREAVHKVIQKRTKILQTPLREVLESRVQYKSCPVCRASQPITVWIQPYRFQGVNIVALPPEFQARLKQAETELNQKAEQEYQQKLKEHQVKCRAEMAEKKAALEAEKSKNAARNAAREDLFARAIAAHPEGAEIKERHNRGVLPDREWHDAVCAYLFRGLTFPSFEWLEPEMLEHDENCLAEDSHVEFDVYESSTYTRTEFALVKQVEAALEDLKKNEPAVESGRVLVRVHRGQCPCCNHHITSSGVALYVRTISGEDYSCEYAVPTSEGA